MSPSGGRPTDDDYWDLFAEDDEDSQRASGVRRHLEAGHVRRAEVRDGAYADSEYADSEYADSEYPDSDNAAVDHARAAAGSTRGGRLYRSVNAPSEPGTEPALRPEDVAHLRTVEAAQRPMVYVSDFDDHRPADDDSADGRRSGRAARREQRRTRKGRDEDVVRADRSRFGLRPLTGYLLVIGLTLATAIAERLLEGPTWTSGLWLTGLALLVSSVYVACTIGAGDFLVAVFAPPLAALVVALTVGQVGAPSAGGFISTHALAAFNTLGASALGGGTSWNWAWILGTTLVSSIIVTIRALVGRR